MVGIQDKKKRVSYDDKSDFALAEELNQFYLQFDSMDLSDEPLAFRAALLSSQI